MMMMMMMMMVVVVVVKRMTMTKKNPVNLLKIDLSKYFAFDLEICFLISALARFYLALHFDHVFVGRPRN